MYSYGERTLEARRQIVRDYLNALPLGAIARYGEVIGLHDGLWAWYDADADAVNQSLAGSGLTALDDPGLTEETAAAYRQVLSLLLAAKKPTTYLSRDRAALDARVDGYLGSLADAGMISPRLRDAALPARLQLRESVSLAVPPFAERKGTDSVRLELLSQHGMGNLHDLERLDLTVRTTLDGAITDDVSRALQQLGDPRYVREGG